MPFSGDVMSCRLNLNYLGSSVLLLNCKEGNKQKKKTVQKKRTEISQDLQDAIFSQVPEPDSAIQSISIDPDGTYMAAVNNKVQGITFSGRPTCAA